MIHTLIIEEFENIRLLIDIVIILFAALIFGYIASKLKQPVILGYMVAGIVIGPFVLSLIGKIEEVHVLAQVGVALLLFVVGLEFSPKVLKKIWKVSVFGGIIEMVSMFLLGFGIGMVFDLGFTQAIFLGAIISVSSTIIIIRVLQNLGEERELAGRIMIGILMVEDAGVILLVTLLSNLFIEGGTTMESYIFPIIMSFAFVILILALGRTVLPIVIKKTSQVENKNLFIVTVLVIALGTASLANLLGIPLALGSFLAGLVLAESRYGVEIVNKIRPLRDIFMIIFFVSIGMSINIMLVGGNLAFVIAFILLMIGGKFTILVVSSKMFGYTTKTAFKVGLGMIQIGEFSFIIAELGYSAELISPTLYSSAITAALITIIITPYSIMNSDSVYEWFRQFDILYKITNKIFPEAKEKIDLKSGEELKNHVVLIGYGKVGHLTVDTIIPMKKKFVVIDHDPKKLEILEELNFPYIYGDATSGHILDRANVDKADMIVVTIPGERDVRMIVDKIRERNPECRIIARVHSEDLKEHLEGKVCQIIYPEVLGSKAVVKKVENLIE